jgi:hypothetical protein
MLIDRYIEKDQELLVKIAFPTGSLKWGTSNLATIGGVVRTDFLDNVIGVAIKFQHYRFL